MVGNGVTDWKYDTQPAFVEMGFQHGLYSTTFEEEKNSLGCDFSYYFFSDANVSLRCREWMYSFNSKTRDINIYEIYNGDGSELFGTGKKPQQYETMNGIEAVPIDDSMTLGATYGDYTPWVFSDLNSMNARRSLGGESATSYLTR